MRHASDTNAAQKACRLLRALSTPVPQRLADIAESSGVNKATALRLIEPRIARRYPRLNIELIRREVLLPRQRSHALLLDVEVDQMGGIGVPVLDSDGRPLAAISLAALTSRITPRLSTLVPQLRNAAEDLSREYAQKDAA